MVVHKMTVNFPATKTSVHYKVEIRSDKLKDEVLLILVRPYLADLSAILNNFLQVLWDDYVMEEFEWIVGLVVQKMQKNGHNVEIHKQEVSHNV